MEFIRYGHPIMNGRPYDEYVYPHENEMMTIPFCGGKTVLIMEHMLIAACFRETLNLEYHL